MNAKHSTDNKIVPARRNPFAVEHVTKIRFRFEEGNWASRLERLEELNYRAAIVGPRGSGKSTLLKELQRQLAGNVESHYVFLPQEKEQHSQLLEAANEAADKGRIILVDGVERITLRQKFHLFRQTNGRGGLIVTSHHAMRYPPFNLPTWVRTKTSELLLDYVLSELEMSSPEIRAAGKNSLAKHRGNIREVLRDLYDRHAARRFKQ